MALDPRGNPEGTIYDPDTGYITFYPGGFPGAFGITTAPLPMVTAEDQAVDDFYGGGAVAVGAPYVPQLALPSNIYQDPGGQTGVGLPQVVPVVVALSAILPLLIKYAPLAVKLFAPFAAGALILWTSLPAPIKIALAAIGIVAGVSILIDVAKNLLGGGSGDGPPGLQVVGQWQANGMTFFRLADGRLAVQNSKGRWKIWRPKRPIVIYAGGAGSLTTLLRADRVLDRQSRRLKRMLARRAPSRGRVTVEPRGLLPATTQVIRA